MSELDPLVANILLKGDDEFLGKIRKVGDETAERFEKLSKSVQAGATQMQTLVGSLSLIEFAIAGVTAATIDYIDKQTALTQSTLLLADAFGTTGGQLQSIEQIFAASGVKVEQFERFAVRLTGTIAREWPAIAEGIRTFANENDAATLRVSNAYLRVQDAQKNLADHSDERSSQMVRDNISLEQSYIKLQFAAQHAAQEQIGAMQSVRGAQLGVEAALQRLATLEGRPPSEADKKNLELAQARQAVDVARKADADARLAEQEKLANAASKQKQLEQEAADNARKAAKNARDDAEQRKKDENAIKDAVIAKAEAEEKEHKLALSNVASIRDALKEVVAGHKDVTSQVNLAEVSVENLKKGFIALANESSKATPPTGFEALRTLSKLFENDINHTINAEQRLRLVTELSGSAMQSLGKSAAEMLHVVENSSAEFEKVAASAGNFKNSIDDNKKTIEEYRGALTQFNLTISQLSQLFAGAVAPAFTAFLRTLNDLFIAIGHSANDDGGYIHELWSGMKELGTAIGTVVTKGGELLAWFAKAASHDNITAMDLLKAALIGIGVALLVATGPLGVWVAALALIATAIGAIKDHASQIGAIFKSAWASVKDNSVIVFFEAVYDVIKRIVVGIGIIFGAKANGQAQLESTGAKTNSTGPSTASLPNLQSNGENTPTFWKGGPVHGFADGGLVGAGNDMLSDLQSGRLTQGTEAYAEYQRKRKAKLKQENPDKNVGGLIYTWDEEGEGYIVKPGQQLQPGNGTGASSHVYAGGGSVKGPGSGTSDSIMARLSNGEFVIKAAAVRAYGANMFHALNNMMLPGFAAGGLVASPVRMGGGAIAPATSTLNLSIDGRSFNGLRGPKSTIDDLSSFAVSRQAAAAGSNPSWMK